MMSPLDPRLARVCRVDASRVPPYTQVSKLEVMLEDLEGQLEESSRQQEALEDQLEEARKIGRAHV